MSSKSDSSKDVQLSKSLSWLLRHGIHKEGLTLDNGGFIDIQDILCLKQFSKFTVEDIMRVVDNNDKKRFTIRTKNGNILQIRANQGHSVPIKDEELLTLLNEYTVPPVIYHGTYLSKLDNIKLKGLSKMRRNHIHFTSALPGEGKVISGFRANCEIAIAVDALKAMNDGLKFYLSDNGVILCPGNEFGYIPAFYFQDIKSLIKN